MNDFHEGIQKVEVTKGTGLVCKMPFILCFEDLTKEGYFWSVDVVCSKNTG